MLLKLIIESIWYYSVFDEDLFFEWIKKISSIVKVEGEGESVYLYCQSTLISDNDLRELLALFYRYSIDMKQLSIFLNEENKHWFFGNKKSYWYKKVFDE